MQEDMHYYGTYAMARCAGLSVDKARTIAHCAQFVDDSSQADSETHEDGGMLYGIATAHDNAAVVKNQMTDHIAQRRVWIPFHFYPGGKGDTFEEKLLCQKDSVIARKMLTENMSKALKSEYGLHLIGITAHVYADTFAHYGFSGMSCDSNKVDGESFKFFNLSKKTEKYIKKKEGLFRKYYRRMVSGIGEAASDGLGHGGVATYPDRPYLRWEFTYQNGKQSGLRDNQKTYLEGAKKLHGYFCRYAAKAKFNDSKAPVDFAAIEPTIKAILAFEGKKEERTEEWRKAIRGNKLFRSTRNEALAYDASTWNKDKEKFHDERKFPTSADAMRMDVYKFHQAAVFHRYNTLKDLLPRHGVSAL